MMLTLSEAEVAKLLTWERLIPAMEVALAAFSSGHVIQPLRNMMTIEEGKRYLGVMPAATESEMGAKLVSFYPGNAGTSDPTHFAVIVLFEAAHGRPLAVMEGRLITEMRTAAVSAAVTKLLAPPDSGKLASLEVASKPKLIWRRCVKYLTSTTFESGAARPPSKKVCGGPWGEGDGSRGRRT
jgi:ornithine cyclodeaminase/alanine dehydrogenase-like protein (mu-crystallin family)